MKEITYRKVNDYNIPNLILPKDGFTNYNIGKYGYLRLNYLKNYKRGFYTELMLDLTLPIHLASIDKEANKREKTIISELAKKENVNEELKQHNQMEWVRLMNNIKNVAEGAPRAYIQVA